MEHGKSSEDREEIVRRYAGEVVENTARIEPETPPQSCEDGTPKESKTVVGSNLQLASALQRFLNPK